MNGGKHTAEPWCVDQTDGTIFEIYGKPDGIIAPIIVMGEFDNPSDPHRAASCVNAMQGIENPAAFREVFGELVDALGMWRRRITSPDGVDIQTLLEVTDTTLAKAKELQS